MVVIIVIIILIVIISISIIIVVLITVMTILNDNNEISRRGVERLPLALLLVVLAGKLYLAPMGGLL